MYRLAIVLTVILIVPAIGVAQESYKDNALRVHAGFWSASVVVGSTGSEVAKLGSEELAELLEARSSTSFEHYESFQSKRKKARWLMIGGAAVAIVGVFVDDNAARAGLVLGGLGVWTYGLSRVPDASNELAQAIYEYNATYAP